MKKEQIVEAARRLFHKFGFKRVSMDEIAMEAGVTKRTIYMYFESKEELLKYFIEEEVLNMKNIIEEVENSNLEFFEMVNEVIYKLLEYRKSRDFLNIIYKEAELLKNQVIANNLKKIDEQVESYIKSKLVIAKEKEYITYEDLDITAFLVYKMYLALMIDWNNEHKKLDEQMIAKSIASILKNGLRKEVI
ncbi:MAG: TetR/AcrR family transcriptional regulator [Clostridia bacterium]|nr:TetR/AcrR family transcriptional regulator [Clostridia bacterium]